MSLPLAPGHRVAEPKCSVLSTTKVSLRVTTLPPLSSTVTTMACLPWARFLAAYLALEAGPSSSRSSPSSTNLTAGTPSWSVALTRTVKRALSSVLSSRVILSTGDCASTYTPSRLARVLPARSTVVMTITDSPSGRSALTAYLPAASACPLALTSPPRMVTVAYGSVMPVKVAGSVLMRPSIRSSSSFSSGTLVSTVKRQSLRTSRRKRLELLARNATACSPSARSAALMVSVSPSRRTGPSRPRRPG